MKYSLSEWSAPRQPVQLKEPAAFALMFGMDTQQAGQYHSGNVVNGKPVSRGHTVRVDYRGNVFAGAAEDGGPMLGLISYTAIRYASWYSKDRLLTR